jgi:ribosomal protein S18 acetylase RimI-like enzyme
MTPHQETAGFEVVDLSHVGAAGLEALLEEENTTWRENLDWDFSASADLVRRFTLRGMLTGNALIAHGIVAGYSYFVVDGHKGLIGDLYVRRALRDARAEGLLLEAVVQRMILIPQLRRIESQLMLLDDPLARRLPAARYAIAHLRNFMMANLDGPPLTPVRLDAGLRIENWSEWRQAEVGHLIADAYQGHIDGQINDQYRSVAGAQRFLTNIVQYPGCGTFFAPASFLAAHASTGRLRGACLASLVAPAVGHITQVCVEPAAQGTGLGYELVRCSLAALAAHGCRKASLTVTSANRNAVSLYERMGFAVRRRFAAYVWEGF